MKDIRIKELINELKPLIAAPSELELEYWVRIGNIDPTIRSLEMVVNFFIIKPDKFILGMNELTNLVQKESFTTDTSSHIIDFLMMDGALRIGENPSSFTIDMGPIWKDDIHMINRQILVLLGVNFTDWTFNYSDNLANYNQQNQRLHAASISLILSIINIFNRIDIFNHLTWKWPNISLDTDASTTTIVLEWWKLDKKLTIDITVDGAEFTKISKIDTTPEIETGTISDDSLKDLIPWLVSNEE